MINKKSNILFFRHILIQTFVLLFFLNGVVAQHSDSLLFDLTGKVVSSDSLKPIQDAHIISKFNKWGTISDQDGYFRMLVSADDSLLISSIGYRKRIIRISDSIRQVQQPVLFKLDIDTVLIHEIVIHGFWDYHTFKQMVINMKPLDLIHFL